MAHASARGGPADNPAPFVVSQLAAIFLSVFDSTYVEPTREGVIPCQLE
jgi:hypothetical protein